MELSDDVLWPQVVCLHLHLARFVSTGLGNLLHDHQPALRTKRLADVGEHGSLFAHLMIGMHNEDSVDATSLKTRIVRISLNDVHVDELLFLCQLFQGLNHLRFDVHGKDAARVSDSASQPHSEEPVSGPDISDSRARSQPERRNNIVGSFPTRTVRAIASSVCPGLSTVLVAAYVQHSDRLM